MSMVFTATIMQYTDKQELFTFAYKFLSKKGECFQKLSQSYLIATFWTSFEIQKCIHSNTITNIKNSHRGSLKLKSFILLYFPLHCYITPAFI